MKKVLSFVVAAALALTLYGFMAQPSQASGPNNSGSYQSYYGSGFQGPQYYGNGNYYKLGYGHNVRSGGYVNYGQNYPTYNQNYYCPNSYYGQPYQSPQAYQQPVHYGRGYAYGQ